MDAGLSESGDPPLAGPPRQILSICGCVAAILRQFSRYSRCPLPFQFGVDVTPRDQIVASLRTLVERDELSAADAGAHLYLHDTGELDLSDLSEENADRMLGQVSRFRLWRAKHELRRIATRGGRAES